MKIFDIFKKRTIPCEVVVNGKTYKGKIDCSKEAISRYERNRNSEASTPVPSGYKRVNIDSFLDKYIKGASIPYDLLQELQRRSIDGYTYADIPISRIEEVERNRQDAIDREQRLARIASLNNEGIAYEKAGNIEAAIEAYRQNVSNSVVASHPYERLMIIYRKRKEYDKEIEVIKKAIEVFNSENVRRAKDAIDQNPTNTTEIEAALKTCTEVRGDIKNRFGVRLICFAPYDVNKYRVRLEKAQELKNKAAK